MSASSEAEQECTEATEVVNKVTDNDSIMESTDAVTVSQEQSDSEAMDITSNNENKENEVESTINDETQENAEVKDDQEANDTLKSDKSQEIKNDNSDGIKLEKYVRPAIAMESTSWSTSDIVQLDRYHCDLNMLVKDDGNSCHPMSKGGFGYMWAGVRSTYGVEQNCCVIFQVKITAKLPINVKEHVLGNRYQARVGWSTGDSSLRLGEAHLSFGYQSDGYKCCHNEFTEFIQGYDVDDVITCYLKLSDSEVEVSFARNTEPMQTAFKCDRELIKGKQLYPHIHLLNLSAHVNFGYQPEPWCHISEGYDWIGMLPVENRVRSAMPPMKTADCTVLLMIGLPCSGKSYWVAEKVNHEPENHWNVLGTQQLMNQIKINGKPVGECYKGRWDDLYDKLNTCLKKLITVAASKLRNYIIDQTNVYEGAQKRKIKPFKGFLRKAVIVVPSDEEYQRRLQARKESNEKAINEDVILEMKANLFIPESSLQKDKEKEVCFDDIIYTDLQLSSAIKLIRQYNTEGQVKFKPALKHRHKENKKADEDTNQLQKLLSKKNERDDRKRKVAGSNKSQGNQRTVAGSFGAGQRHNLSRSGPKANVQGSIGPNFRNGPQPNFGNSPRPNFGGALGRNFGSGPEPNFGGGPRPNLGGDPRPHFGGAQRPSFGGGPGPNFGGGPGPNFGGGPGPNFGGGPGPKFGGGPGPNFGGGPGPNFRGGPESNFGGGPGPNFGGGPESNFGGGPGPNFGDGPGPNFGDGPGPNFGGGPGPNFGGGPGPNFGGGPGPNFGGGPGPNFGGGPGPNFGGGHGPSFKGGGPSFEGGPEPGFGGGPGSKFGVGPGSNFGSGSGPKIENGSGSNFGRATGPNFGDNSGPNFVNGSRSTFRGGLGPSFGNGPMPSIGSDDGPKFRSGSDPRFEERPVLNLGVGTKSNYKSFGSIPRQRASGNLDDSFTANVNSDINRSDGRSHFSPRSRVNIDRGFHPKGNNHNATNHSQLTTKGFIPNVDNSVQSGFFNSGNHQNQYNHSNSQHLSSSRHSESRNDAGAYTGPVTKASRRSDKMGSGLFDYLVASDTYNDNPVQQNDQTEEDSGVAQRLSQQVLNAQRWLSNRNEATMNNSWWHSGQTNTPGYSEYDHYQGYYNPTQNHGMTYSGMSGW